MPTPAILLQQGKANYYQAKMTLEEKVGQMLQPDQAHLTDIGDIRKYNLGSLLSGGDSDPKGGNSMQEWTAMYERYQAEAVKSRLGIPLLYGIDAVHGHSNVLGAVIFPHNIGLGATRKAQLVEKVGRITALEMRATGIHWTFAPSVAVPRDERWGRTYEGFGEAPELARDLGAAATRGLQGKDLADSMSVLACAKHFAGDGGTLYGTGGWTIQWQGKAGEVTTGGTTILQAIRKAVMPATEVSTSRDGSGAEGATVGVAVIGELPYAEMFGDRSDLSLTKEDIDTVANLKKAGVPVVVVLISGRPMILDSVLAQSNALVAAWLPGTEGQGVADVLFGDYRPSGKLPFSWPRSNAQLPINIGDAAYDPLFRYGFGLSY